MSSILRAAEVDSRSPVGGKARALARLRGAGLPIPPWVVLLPEALQASLTIEQRHTLEQGGEGVATVVEQVKASATVCDELRHALAELCPAAEPVAVRSSASDEDGPQHSFAGQLDSFLFVPPDQVAARVADVWRSGFSPRIYAYRRENGLSLPPRPPAVLIQRMVQADTAGVAFGADPVSGRRGVAVVAAVCGLGSGLVSGDCDADTWHVDRDGQIIRRAIATKRIAHRPDPASIEGVRAVEVPDDEAKRPALTDAQVLAVADLVRRCGAYFGRPQDIEWAIENDKLYLLQSRPITSLAGLADPDGVLNLWDNSNIAESYNGVTTPLTFSFARRAYEEVYRQFCRILSVPEAVIADKEDVFRRMLGLVRGRIYYNLLNWYRVLALLPGFTVNRRFMEQMMGVKEGLPETIAAELGQAGWRQRLGDAFRFVGSLAALAMNHVRIGGTIRRFYARLEQALGKEPPNLQRLRPDELATYYRDLECQLLTRWDAPLINDFLAMIFFGVLRKLAVTWCGDTEGTLANDLLCGEGGMISAEPALRVRRMANMASRNPELVQALCDAPLDRALETIQRHPEFEQQYRDYLRKFGDRCLEELKLESPTLHDDPSTLLRSVGQLARASGECAIAAPQDARSPEQRQRAAQRVRAALGWHPLRRLLFAWVLKNARARVRDRENLRFERTRLFGRVRSIFVEMGRQLHALDLLDDPRDVFYLELGEVLGFVDATVSCTDLKGLVRVRRTEFDRYRREESPADRFETHGIVYQGNSFRGTAKAAELAGDTRHGLGCCPGVVRGVVRVITDPRQAVLRRGEILVAERTDPGWIMLFPSAAGLLVERGSLLSHSAIVAREMSIPAIVSVPGVMTWLKDGDEVELDGGTGIVKKISEGANHEQ